MITCTLENLLKRQEEGDMQLSLFKIFCKWGRLL